MAELTRQGHRVTSFPRQFVLAKGEQAVPAGWIRKTIRGWSLWHCPSLSAHSIVDEGARDLGWLLGDIFLPPAAGSPLTIAHPVRSAGFATGLESALRDIPGQFVALVLDDSFGRVYTDPAAQLGVVFNAAEQRVASSLRLAATVDHPDAELIEVLDIPRHDRYFPFGLTPDLRVRRLLPHHYLDLDTFETTRYWPTPHVRFGTATETESVVQAIAARVRQNVENIAASDSLALSLTAGRDSRMVLAAARRLLPNVASYTYGLPDKKAQLDCRVASAIARRFRFRHELVEWVEPTGADLQDWQERAGHCVAGRTWQLATTKARLREEGLRLSGMCGEVGRCFFWRREDLDASTIAAQQLVERLRLPVHPRLCAEAELWLQSLPAKAPPDVLDLLYMEQRLGCWAGPQAYGHATASVAPMCDRQVLEAMVGLPWAYRFEQRLAVDFIAHLWPDLLAFPFNRELGSGVLTKLKNRARRVWRAVQA